MKHCLYPCLAALVLLLTGCAGEDHPQSVLDPRGPAASSISDLWWLLFWVCTVVFVVVLVLTGWAISRRASAERAPADKFVVVAGIILPTLILIGLLIASMQTSMNLREPEAQMTIRVVGRQFWWDVYYPDHGLVSANEVHIPAGTPVRIELESGDVIHSFWVPNLHGKFDMLPGHSNSMVLQADEPGIYRGQCAEFCGIQHALMALYVVAMKPAEFEAWVQERRQQVVSLERGEQVGSQPLLARGREIYRTQRCDACHMIAGEGSSIGPNLTHLGSRRSLGAATIPNTPENLAAWIREPQDIKPGNFMPGFDLPPEDMAALVAYLESLE